MGYIKYNLQPGERVVLAARVHRVILVPGVVAFVAAFLFLGWEMVAFRSPRGLTDAAAGLLLWASGLCFLMAVALGVWALVTIVTTELAVTGQRVIGKQGWMPERTLGVALPRIEGVSVRTLDLLYPRIESVTVQQDFIGEILDLGTLTIIGMGGMGGRFAAIQSPIAVQMKINHMIDRITEATA